VKPDQISGLWLIGFSDKSVPDALLALVPPVSDSRLDYFSRLLRIDLTGFPKKITEEVIDHVLQLPRPDFDRIIPIGF